VELRRRRHRPPDGVRFWTRLVDAVRAAGDDGALSIENEDYTLDQRESVALAVDTLRQALAAATR
jgi:sugar phosphate isomerase/epimerase